MKVTPCLNLACRALIQRPDGAPAPTACPRCGSTNLLDAPRPRPSVLNLLRADGDPR